MGKKERYTEAEAHRRFAVQFNGTTWDLLGKADRTKEDDEVMIASAFASLRHWLEIGTGVHQQRGEWLIAHVYSVLGVAGRASYHATRCLQLTELYVGELEDFDRAYAYEAVARAHAIAGNQDEAVTYIDLAVKAGRAISDDQSREIFVGDFDSGPWAGLR
jgi:hypothetical protein